MSPEGAAGPRREPGNDEAVPAAEVVTVGDEILIGETVDTNAAWIGRRLSGLGLQVTRRAAVSDDRGEIQAAVSAALGRAELVVVTGGLGPTDDDLTKPSVAMLLGRPLELREALLEALEDRFRERGFTELPEPNRSQAEVPEGATVLPNPVGTAPGLVLESEGRLVVLLPGVPREMKALFDPPLDALLRERFAGRLRPLRQRTLRTTGVAESRLAEVVEEALPADTGPLSLAFLPEPGAVDIRLTTRADEEEAERWFGRIEERLRAALGDAVYGRGEGDLADAVGELLRARAATLAVAESCTGGMVGERITGIPGSSDYFVGGVIAYADRVKVGSLGVSTETLEAEGAVSEPVAREMASGARRALSADVAVAVTGIAGPGGGTGEKPVGTVWYAAALGDDDVRAEKDVFPGGRESVRERSVQAVLTLLWTALRDGAGGGDR